MTSRLGTGKPLTVFYSVPSLDNRRGPPMKETPRIITVTSSFFEISPDQLRNTVILRRLVARPIFLIQASGQIFKDDVNGFSSPDICFIGPSYNSISSQWEITRI